MTIPLSSATAQEIPNPPATFAGTVTVDGHNVSDGTEVVALIEGKVCGEGERVPGQKGTWTATEARPEYGIESGDSMYVVDVLSDSQEPGCGTDGATVTFLIAGRPSHQVGLWKAGSNPLNLTVGTPSAGEEPTSPASEPETSDDSGFNWWPVAAGGAGLAAVAIAAALWQVVRTARRKQA
ncbi:MAG: hypothetical protein JSU97_04685 [Dehalococcoidia bacterium]|nr:MAG: hypothetical protein JSU97_04685 [Dehalococcoidia bacterium]